MSDLLLSTRRLSSELGLPFEWLRKEADAGRIPVLRAGRKRLFNLAAVKHALAGRACGTGTFMDKPSVITRHNPDVDKLRDIAEAIRQWNPTPPFAFIVRKDDDIEAVRGKVHPTKTLELMAGARRAMGLMRDNLPLLRQVAGQYGGDHAIRPVLDKVQGTERWPIFVDLGERCWDWWIDFTWPRYTSAGDTIAFTDVLYEWALKIIAEEASV